MDARKFFSKVGFSYFIMIVLMVALELVLDMILSAFAPRLLARYPSMYWVVNFLPQYFIAMPVCILLLRRLPAMQINRNYFGPGNWFRMLCISVFIMEAGGIIGNLLSALINRFTPVESSSDVSNLMMTGSLWVVFLFSVIIAPVIEELVFRKALIDRTVVFGDRASIVLSGLMFGLVHGNIYQFFYAFGLGCLFAYIYIRTGKIRHTISFHMAVNFLGGFIGTVLIERLENSQGYGNVSSLFYQIGTLVGMFMLGILLLALAVAGLIMLLFSCRKAVFLPGEYSMPAKQTCRAVLGNVGMILFLIASAFLFVLSFL